MDLPAPAPDGSPARGLRAVTSWRLRNTPARRARAMVAQAQDQSPDQPSDRRTTWWLRSTPARRARSAAQGQAQTKTSKRKWTRCRELNADALSDVLLLLPAKDLCRLRAVCHSWRSTTVDPHFITWHMSRHPGPLFLAKFKGDQGRIHVVDLSGRVVKTMADNSANHTVMFSRLNVACLATDWNRCRVLNPATGAVHVLPQDPAMEHRNRVNLSNPYTYFALGRVASSGEYKVLRMFNRPGFMDLGQQLFEVYTINGGAAHAQWRARQSPEFFVEPRRSVVVDGVVYFLALIGNGIPPDYIMSFDLESEEWSKNIIGPISGDIEALKRYRVGWDQLALAELNGHVVLVYYHWQPYTMDLWFLSDLENGTWVRKYSIRIVRKPIYRFQVKPLLILDDGRIVLYQVPIGQLHIYNPETNSFEDVRIRRLDSVGFFTGSLLSLQQEGDML